MRNMRSRRGSDLPPSPLGLPVYLIRPLSRPQVLLGSLAGDDAALVDRFAFVFRAACSPRCGLRPHRRAYWSRPPPSPRWFPVGWRDAFGPLTGRLCAGVDAGVRGVAPREAVR